MDWSKAHTPAAPRPAPAAPPRLSTLFRVVGASGRPLRCGVYRVATGHELRLEYEDRSDDVLRTQLFRSNDEDGIATKATEWRAALDRHGFRDLAVMSQP